MFNIPSNLLPWLNTPTSITEKLKHHSGQAQVNLIGQETTRASWWEHVVLAFREPVIRREVIITSHFIPCWYARTLIPISTYTAQERFFSQLKTKSLGELIYDNYMISRKINSPYWIDKTHLEYYWFNENQKNINSHYWVRPSQFLVYDQFPFYLFEIFFPQLLELADAQLCP